MVTKFDHGKRQQVKDARPTGQALADGLQEQKVVGPRQYIMAWFCSISVSLQIIEKGGESLGLIDEQTRVLGNIHPRYVLFANQSTR